MHASDASAPSKRWFPWWAVGIGVVALGIRLLFFFQFSQTPFAKHLFLDSEYYDQWATRIAGGDWLGDRPFFFEPGYAYLLAFLKLAGGGIDVVRLIHALLGTATAVLTAFVARRLAGDGAGILAGLLAALYLPCIFYEGLVLKTTLEVFLGMSLLGLLFVANDRPSLALWGGIGLLIGLAGLVKGNFLVLLPGIALWSWSVHRRRAQSRPYLPAMMMLGGCIVGIAIPTVRNYAVSREWIPLVYESGYNFYIGNGPEADGARLAPSFVRAASKYEELDSNAEAVRRAGRQLTYSEISAFWWKETWKSIRDAPLRWLKLLGVKFLLFWNRYECSDNISLYFVREWVPLLRWPLPGWWLVGPLGLAGLAVALWKRDESWLLVAGYVVLLMLALISFKVVDRYRLAAAPAMLALGSAAVVQAWRERRRNGPVVGVAALAGVVLTNLLPNPVFPHGQNLANHFEMLGVCFADEGDAAAAIEQFRKAVAAAPDSRTAHYNLGRALHRLGPDTRAAEESVREAVRLDPGYGEAHCLLGDILLRRERSAEAAGSFLMAARLGFKPGSCFISAAGAFGRAERYEEAQQALDEGLRIQPDDPMGLEVLGNLRYVRGDLAGALEAWERSLSFKPENANLRTSVESLRTPRQAVPNP